MLLYVPVNALLLRLRPVGLLLLLLLAAWCMPSDAQAQARGAKGSKAKVSKQRGKASAKRNTSRPSNRKATTSLRLGKKGAAPWQKRRTQKAADSGLKDHASRHSQLSPKEYLQLGQTNVSRGRMLKGGGRHVNARYHIRKLDTGDFSMTITNKNGKILSIDTWKSQGAPLTKEAIERGLRSSGVTTPKGFWKKL